MDWKTDYIAIVGPSQFSAGSCRLRPSRLLVFVQGRRGKVDAPRADDRLVAQWALPAALLDTIHRRSILRFLQTHRTRILGRGRIRSVENNISVGDAQTLAADTTAVVTFEHGNVLGPLALTEVAKDIRHLHVIGVGAGLSHVGSINAETPKCRNAAEIPIPSGSRRRNGPKIELRLVDESCSDALGPRTGKEGAS